MKIEIIKTIPEEISTLRLEFLEENRFQFIHNKCHEYGWADVYLTMSDGKKIGYGSTWGNETREVRDTIFEFFLTKPYRNLASAAYSQFISVTGVKWLECQTNDPLLSSVFF